MNPRSNERSTWHRVDGRWSISLGMRGVRVRLFENRSGVFYRDVWINGKKNRRSLNTRSRDEALRLGKLLLAELLRGPQTSASLPLTLGSLWDCFQTQCAQWLDNNHRSQKDDRHRADVLVAYFGKQLEVSSLTPDAVVGYQNKRMAGGIALAKGRLSRPVRVRSVQAELSLLRSMLRWATRSLGTDGKPLLARDPLNGIRVARESNDLRPVTDYDRFKATRKSIAEWLTETDDPFVTASLRKVDLALCIAEATGRRIGSIAQLRWEDFDFGAKLITWRAEADKKRKEWVVPLPDSLRIELLQARKRVGSIAGLVFPSPDDSDVPMSRHLLSYWLRRAEARAKLPKLKGGLWHPYRRKWATERKGYSTSDVMAVGGWLDHSTFLRSYQLPDQATLVRVANEPPKLRQFAN